MIVQFVGKETKYTYVPNFGHGFLSTIEILYTLEVHLFSSPLYIPQFKI